MVLFFLVDASLTLKLLVIVVNYANYDAPSRKRIRPTSSNHKSSDSDIGMIETKHKDQEADQTKYNDETTTERFVDYYKNGFRQVYDEPEIKTENSLVSNQINTERPDNSLEETTLYINESNENSVAILEDTTQVSI